MTALHHACANGRTDVVRHLMNSDANISAIDNVSHYAVDMLIIFLFDLLINHYNSYEVFGNFICSQHII